MSFDVIPAIDLCGGRVVRLQQGDFARVTRFPDDPVELACRYADEGATWLHVVDLDGARLGGCGNLPVIEAIVKVARLRVQAGGGVRGPVDVARLLGVGVARVVVGSVAVREPDVTVQWLQQFGAEHLVLALDARRDGGGWQLPMHGWLEASGADFEALVVRYAHAGAQNLLCTDIDRDGMLAGFNLDLYRDLKAIAPAVAIQASGGARSLKDIRAAREAGASAVVLGRALLEHRFALPDALAC